MQMHALVSADLFPARESGGEGPAFDCEAYAAKEGNVRIVWVPEGARERVRIAGWRGRGSHVGGDRGRSGFSNVRGWGKIVSRGE